MQWRINTIWEGYLLENAGDSGYTMQPEFNKHISNYEVEYNNPPTSGEIQDKLRKKEDEERKK